MELLKGLVCGLLAIVIAGCGANSAPKRELPTAADVDAAKFLITASDGEHTGKSVVYFLSHYALETTAPNEPVQAIYDLSEMSWTLTATGERTTLEECRAWAKKASESLRKQQSRIKDANGQVFVQRTLEPQLTVEKNAGKLTIKNEYITYTVLDPLRPSQEVLANFFRYDMLNTYRKCMRDRLLPPFVGLEASSIMWQHGMLPAQMTMDVDPPDGQRMTIGVLIEFQPITDQEKKYLAETLAKARSTSTPPEPAEAVPAKAGDA